MPELRDFVIGGHRLGENHPCFIIAEIGINHGGSEALAAEMIDAAAESGADAVKLQTVTPEESYHPATESYRIFRDSSLPRDALERLVERARRKGIELFSTPGDFRALSLMLKVGMPAVKISSGLMTNHPLVIRAAESGLPLIISTGMARMDEVVTTVAAARGAGATQIAILQCTSVYPAPGRLLNLRTMSTLGTATECLIGYSDHFDGTLACVAAVAAGAKVIEKHFTLDRSREGDDHAISIEPDIFKTMTNEIRQVENMLGRSEKYPTYEELRQRELLHRKLVARRDIAAGEELSEDDILLMRLPPDMPGLPSNKMAQFVGKKTLRPISRLTGIGPADVDGVE